VKSALFFDNGRDLTSNLSTVTTPCDLAAALRKGDLREQNPLLRRPYDQRTPDFRPQPTSPALTGAASLPTDPFFAPVTYVGAFGADDGDDWTQGWTAYPEN
jgi:hypothetical protein